MAEMNWDIKRGAEIYRSVYGARLKNWISLGKIKAGEALVWRSGLSGWRKPEELEELVPYFRRWERYRLREIRKKIPERKISPIKKDIKNILIVDDEEDLCSLLHNTLSEKGYNVTTASTKREGMNLIKRTSPDLVFLDLKLPDGDGMQNLSKIKKISPNTVVNMISAYGSEERREEAAQKGAHTFIDKPFTEKEILRSIKSFGKK